MHINAWEILYGLWACLRAYNDKFADIVFRIHAEFKFEDGWFTPSQFAGHLVIDRIKERVDISPNVRPWRRGKFRCKLEETTKTGNSFAVTQHGLLPTNGTQALGREVLYWKTLNSQNPSPKRSC